METNEFNLGDLGADEKWREVLILYSGLIESEELKNEFIQNLRKKDSVLAAQCISSDWKNHYSVEELIEKDAEGNLKLIFSRKEEEMGFKSYFTLLELGKTVLLLEVIKTCPPEYISKIKNTIPKILDLSKEVKYAVYQILENNPHFFFRQVLDYLFDKADCKDVLIEIFYKFLENGNIKTKHLFSIIKFFGPDFRFNLNEDQQVFFVKHIRSYNDLIFIQASTSFSLKFREIFETISNEAVTVNLAFFIIDIFNNNALLRRNLLPIYINNLSNSGLTNKIVLSYILSISFNYKLDSSIVVPKSLRNKGKLNEALKNLDTFYKIFMKATDELEAKNIKLSANNLLGKKLHAIVQSEWKYHYYLRAADIKLPLLLPKSEIEKSLKEGSGCKVVIIYFDNQNDLLFCSVKQNKEDGPYNIDLNDLYVAKVGDQLKAKVIKYNGKISSKVFGIGKKVYIKIANPNFPYKNYINLYDVTVVKVNKFNSIEIRVGKPTK